MEEQSNTNALAVFTDMSNVIRQLDIPSRDVILAFNRAALNMVAADVKANNIARAIDTMQKTKAIEDYVKARIRQQHGNLNLANEVTATRFRELREIGWWLDENTFDNGDNHPVKKGRAIPNIGEGKSPFLGRTILGINEEKYLNFLIETGEKPRFFYSELNISETQGNTWKQVARIPDDKFEEYIAEYLKDGDIKVEKYLYLSRLLSWWYEKDDDKEKEIVIPEEIKSKEGQQLYRWMYDGKERITGYIGRLRTQETPATEVMVIVGLPFWRNVFATWRELDKLVKVEDGKKTEAE